jgi:hypothetical protein
VFINHSQVLEWLICQTCIMPDVYAEIHLLGLRCQSSLSVKTRVESEKYCAIRIYNILKTGCKLSTPFSIFIP